MSEGGDGALAVDGASRIQPRGDAYDILILGGGFFGCRLAHHVSQLRSRRVLLVEAAGTLMSRASFANQARIHNGYHYPRSVPTALRSRVNSPRFSDEFHEAVVSSFEAFYGVASIGSHVTASQFRTFCERIGAPLEPAPKEVLALFEKDRVEQLFRVVEPAFDASALRARAERDLQDAGVETLVSSSVERLEATPGAIRATIRTPEGVSAVVARRVFDCTYSRLNRVLAASGVPLVPLKHEITELCLVEPPPEIDGRAFTIMCGPFFSIMPFPARQLHSISHVRYTPHVSWYDGDTAQYRDPFEMLASYRKESRFPHMLRDARRYLPVIEGCRFVSSLFEVKTVLPRSDVDDSRPILFKRHPAMEGLVSILGAKIDNIYDIFAFADRELERERA